MTEVVVVKIAMVLISGIMLFWAGEELFQHVRHRDRAIRWQWKTSHVENRTADTIWIRSLCWLTFQLVASLVLATVFGWIVVTR